MRSEQDREARPAWIFEFTDGGATDLERLSEAKKATTIADEMGIQIFPIAVGPHPYKQTMEDLAQPGRPPRHLREIDDFKRFFQCLFEMLRSRSCSAPNQTILSDFPCLDGPEWKANA